MGTFYRSKHELVFVFKVGTAPHLNSFGLGETGRYRTNVWDYPGVSSLGATRAEALAMHPTVKPVALVADAIRDCSRRVEIVLDAFGGSGTTLIAAETCGRSARLVEYDPAYCDTILQRWQQLTGKAAILAGTGATFEMVAGDRQHSATVAGASGPAPASSRTDHPTVKARGAPGHASGADALLAPDAIRRPSSRRRPGAPVENGQSHPVMCSVPLAERRS